MQPSSLIFVVIVAVWAVYLLQHWIRRREVLVTARSVDQFSEAMRVLERRDAELGTTPQEHHARPRDPLPRTLLRAGSVMTDATPRSSHSVPRPRDVGAPPAGGGTPGSARDFAESPAEQTPTAADEPVQETGTGIVPAPVRVGSRVIRGLASLNSRRVRGLVLLASTALLVCAVVLAPLRMLPWWSPIVSLLLVGAVFGWLRLEAVAAQRARAEQRAADEPDSRSARDAEDSRSAQGDREQQVAVTAAPSGGPRLGRVPLPAREAVFDGARPAAQQQAKPAPVAEQVEGGWSPVPVPRPTYTMKAKAERPAAPVADPPRTMAQRHADTGVEDLPFDGMALDQDLEELPSAFRVG